MKTFALILSLIALSGTARADERTVIVPGDDKPFTVEMGDLVRLTGKGISGSRIEATVDGPAKVESISVIRRVSNGRPLIGAYSKEFDLKPTEAGKVTVTITTTPPQPDAEPIVSKYTFEVKASEN